MFAGSDSAGPVVSRTVITNEVLMKLPKIPSVAVHRTSESPSGKVDPDGGVQVTVGLKAPEVVTTYGTTAPFAPVASTIRSSGAFRSGVSVYSTVTRKLPVVVPY